MVDVDVGGNQRFNGADVKVDVLALPAVAGLLPLEQAAVQQQAVVGVNVQLVARAADAGSGAGCSISGVSMIRCLFGEVRSGVVFCHRLAHVADEFRHKGGEDAEHAAEDDSQGDNQLGRRATFTACAFPR